jgi:hypothetical protein
VRRFPLAFVLVGVMGLLAAGGAVLGAFQAPTGTDLAVHNGAGETLQASRVVGTYTTSDSGGEVVSFVFDAPDHVFEEAIGSTGKVEARRHVSGGKASSVLSPVQQLLSLESFSAHGSYYDNTRPASVLAPSAPRGSVTGTYLTRVELEGGYVVAIFLRIDAHIDENGQREHVTETVKYNLSRVDGWSRSG